MFGHQELTGFDFEGVDGLTHTIYGCSLEGVFVFRARLAELEALARGEEACTIEQLYVHNQRFRFLVNECLKLNGLQPEWVSLHQIEQLLFFRQTEQGPRLGWLVELNRPKQVEQLAKGLSEYEDLVANLARMMNGDLEGAYSVLRSVPARELLAVLAAWTEQTQPPKEKQRRELRAFARREREERSRGETPVA